MQTTQVDLPTTSQGYTLELSKDKSGMPKYKHVQMEKRAGKGQYYQVAVIRPHILPGS